MEAMRPTITINTPQAGPIAEMRPILKALFASLAGALGMVALMKFVVPKYPKLAEYSLGIAMIIGMVFAVIYDLSIA